MLQNAMRFVDGRKLIQLWEPNVKQDLPKSLSTDGCRNTYKARILRMTVPPKYKRAKKRSQHQKPAEKNRMYDNAPSFWANVAAMV